MVYYNLTLFLVSALAFVEAIVEVNDPFEIELSSDLQAWSILLLLFHSNHVNSSVNENSLVNENSSVNFGQASVNFRSIIEPSRLFNNSGQDNIINSFIDPNGNHPFKFTVVHGLMTSYTVNGDENMPHISSVGQEQFDAKYYACPLTIELLQDAITWVKSGTKNEVESTEVVKSVEHGIRELLSSIQDIPFFGPRQKLFECMKRLFGDDLPFEGGEESTLLDLRRYLTKNFSLKTKVIIHLIDGLRRMAAYGCAVLQHAFGDVGEFENSLKSYADRLEENNGKSDLEHEVKLRWIPGMGEYSLPEMVNRCKVESTWIQYMHQQATAHNGFQMIMTLVEAISAKGFKFLLPEPTDQGLGQAMSRPANNKITPLDHLKECLVHSLGYTSEEVVALDILKELYINISGQPTAVDKWEQVPQAFTQMWMKKLLEELKSEITEMKKAYEGRENVLDGIDPELDFLNFVDNPGFIHLFRKCKARTYRITGKTWSEPSIHAEQHPTNNTSLLRSVYKPSGSSAFKDSNKQSAKLNQHQVTVGHFIMWCFLSPSSKKEIFGLLANNNNELQQASDGSKAHHACVLRSFYQIIGASLHVTNLVYYKGWPNTRCDVVFGKSLSKNTCNIVDEVFSAIGIIEITSRQFSRIGVNPCHIRLDGRNTEDDSKELGDLFRRLNCLELAELMNGNLVVFFTVIYTMSLGGMLTDNLLKLNDRFSENECMDMIANKFKGRQENGEAYTPKCINKSDEQCVGSATIGGMQTQDQRDQKTSLNLLGCLDCCSLRMLSSKLQSEDEESVSNYASLYVKALEMINAKIASSNKSSKLQLPQDPEDKEARSSESNSTDSDEEEGGEKTVDNPARLHGEGQFNSNHAPEPQDSDDEGARAVKPKAKKKQREKKNLPRVPARAKLEIGKLGLKFFNEVSSIGSVQDHGGSIEYLRAPLFEFLAKATPLVVDKANSFNDTNGEKAAAAGGSSGSSDSDSANSDDSDDEEDDNNSPGKALAKGFQNLQQKNKAKRKVGAILDEAGVDGGLFKR